MNIEDSETERLAAEVAVLTGESKTVAVRVALRERRDRLTARSESATILLTRRLTREGQDAEQALRDAVDEASAIAMRFPRLKARIEQAEGTGYGEAPGNGFDDGLETILDGVERRLSPR